MDSEPNDDSKTLTEFFGWLADKYPREWEEKLAADMTELETLKYFFELAQKGNDK